MLRWTYYYSSTVLSGNIWQELELESEPPKLWTKVEPEPKINNFGSATLVRTLGRFGRRHQTFCQNFRFGSEVQFSKKQPGYDVLF